MVAEARVADNDNDNDARSRAVRTHLLPSVDRIPMILYSLHEYCRKGKESLVFGNEMAMIVN